MPHPNFSYHYATDGVIRDTYGLNLLVGALALSLRVSRESVFTLCWQAG
ncbi:hypothetical protein K3495_g4532 [Podosphaera aphanis]|nr:hypothetical protein K3495_g4532 [Podosphaera aphanis]